MIRSMTGFGRAEGVVGDRKVTVEVRSLNSKQLDLFLKLPAALKERENEVRQRVGEQLIRGKAEVFVSSEGLHAAKRTTFDKELVRAYYDELKAIRDSVDPQATTDLFAQVLRLPDVANTTNERLSDAEWDAVFALIDDALTAFNAFRSSEGERLRTELALRVEAISTLLNEVAAADQGRAERTRERLHTKLVELGTKVDQDRFEQELIFYLEKMDMTEEKVRLRSHCTYFNETMAHAEAQGRKLGFIAQEMGREINTLGSKANDASIQQQVVMMKDELEKVKEQVLNVL
ncbi:MAG TPA: YicC family protein [Flavobacteriales bacterium]|nr:YicC family protein [Flavobacteriales bacterium]